MKLTYDPRYNVAYIHLKEKTAEVEKAYASRKDAKNAKESVSLGKELVYCFE